jgi:hypothetical protein
MQVGAVFGLILALIVMAVVLFFGSGQIANIICIGNVGQTNNAIKNLESLVDDIQASAEGSSDTFRLSIPQNAEVCFIDPEDPSISVVNGWVPDDDMWPIIQEKILSQGYNVWIEYKCGNPESGYKMKYVVTPEPGQKGNFCAGSGETILLTNVDTNEGVRVMVEKLD